MAFTQRVFDSFTDTGLTALQSHTPNQGLGYGIINGVLRINAGGNALETTGSGIDNIAINNTALANNQAAAISIGDATQFVGVGIRLGDGLTEAALTGYFAFAFSATSVRIDRCDNGVFTTLITSAGSSPYSVGDILYLEVVGNAIIAKLNGVPFLNTNDNTYTSGKVGLYGFSTCTLASDFWGYDDNTVGISIPFSATIGAKRV